MAQRFIQNSSSELKKITKEAFLEQVLGDNPRYQRLKRLQSLDGDHIDIMIQRLLKYESPSDLRNFRRFFSSY